MTQRWQHPPTLGTIRNRPLTHYQRARRSGRKARGYFHGRASSSLTAGGALGTPLPGAPSTPAKGREENL